MNWGYKLMFTFIAFSSMMGYLVYRSFRTNFELVGKDYYKDELRYQRVIDGADRANLLYTAVALEQSSDKIILQMPVGIKNKKIAGSVLFYCAYDSGKDKRFILSTDSNGVQIFKTGQVTPGRYTAKVDWNMDEKNFYTEKLIIVY